MASIHVRILEVLALHEPDRDRSPVAARKTHDGVEPSTRLFQVERCGRGPAAARALSGRSMATTHVRFWTCPLPTKRSQNTHFRRRHIFYL